MRDVNAVPALVQIVARKPNNEDDMGGVEANVASSGLSTLSILNARLPSGGSTIPKFHPLYHHFKTCCRATLLDSKVAPFCQQVMGEV